MNLRIKNCAVLAVTASLTLCISSCSAPPRLGSSDLSGKVQLDLSVLDEDGLRGPPDGRVAVSYEFAIPNTEECRSEVAAIDHTIRFMEGSPGRIGAGEGQCLCIGSTHQAGYREVLRRLASRPYVEKIVECYFE